MPNTLCNLCNAGELELYVMENMHDSLLLYSTLIPFYRCKHCSISQRICNICGETYTSRHFSSLSHILSRHNENKTLYQAETDVHIKVGYDKMNKLVTLKLNDLFSELPHIIYLNPDEKTVDVITNFMMKSGGEITLGSAAKYLYFAFAPRTTGIISEILINVQYSCIFCGKMYEEGLPTFETVMSHLKVCGTHS